MNIKVYISAIVIAIAAPQYAYAQLINNLPVNPIDNESQVSTSNSDLVNQNQNTVTNNDTNQSSTGVVQQSATYNVGQASSYDFRGINGITIRCPKPAILVSGGAGFGALGSSYQQASAALVVPLGGKLSRNCTKVSNQIIREQEQYLLQKLFNDQYDMASRCVSLKKSGASINATVFPELAEICKGIDLKISTNIETNNPAQSSEIKQEVVKDKTLSPDTDESSEDKTTER